MKAADSTLPTISIVIPAYNEAARIGDSVRNIARFAATLPHQTELIIVDDGSTDETARVVEDLAIPNLKLLPHAPNRGKGYSVKQGALAAAGDYVLFTDADLSAPIEEMLKLLAAALDDNLDVVVGSRALNRSFIGVHQPKMRELGGMLFNVVVRWMLGLKIYDTQCGFKLFKRSSTVAVFQKQTIDGFGFDPELLFLASRQGLRIRETAVRWNHAEGSKVRLARDAVRMFADVVRIRWNHFTGRYS